ncbi:MAG: efflux RND transporter permease subunit [Pseudomonadota bacterium]|nr:efflux RND transporter permease subunit [Pseudomonadota bacterium]
MHFTDIFVKRPVLAIVVSLVIFLLGLRAAQDLTVREYPEIQNARISISVVYPGADPELVEGFITTPLEREIASADGIDFLTSNSAQGLSSISANLKIDKDPNEALTEISAKVNKLRSQLPEGSEDPVIQLAGAGDNAAMYLSCYCKTRSKAAITDYVARVVEPELSALSGVERAVILGGRNYAMRIWFDPERLAAHNMTPGEAFSAVKRQNVLSAVGETKGQYVKVGISADTDLSTVEAFRDLVLRSEGTQLVRLRDVADVVFGDESYDYVAHWDAEPGLFIGIEVRPDANLLDVTAEIREMWPRIHRALPESIEANISYDSTVYVNAAISDVQATLIEAVIIVILVIFLFLGSLRSSMIPAVTVPLSLVGALFLMYSMGFSINLLTLLAMVLAIGMVVDDAIIVLENIHRHIEEGMEPSKAALVGARELLGPVIAMTITLVAVYAPIGFLTGMTGKLFTEFAFTLAGAVLISGVIALTLTPMMCAKILQSHDESGSSRLERFLDEKFEYWRQGYKQRLHSAMDQVNVIGVFGLVVLVSCYFLYQSSDNELAPAEDLGFAGVIAEGDGYASPEYFTNAFLAAQNLALEHPNVDHTFAFTISESGESNKGFIGLIGTPWDARTKTMGDVANDLSMSMESVAPLRLATFQPPPLPTPGQGYPVEFILKSTAEPQLMAEVGDELVKRAMASKRFFYVASQLNFDRPEAEIIVDRDKAGLLGVDMQSLSLDLSAMMAGAEVNRFSYMGRSYKVIAQVEREERLNPQQLTGYYTRAASGDLIPISTLVEVVQRTKPRSIPHAQQLNANTIIAVPRPDVSQGEALALLEGIANDIMPANFQLDYAGSSRQFKQEGGALVGTFAFALLIIYLVLAAQFESFRDPLIILVTVPMSVCGALLCINIFALTNGMQLTTFPGMTLNIYTQVGLVTLIGVISKHGILMVDFANRLQEQGVSKREAIEEAASIRLRPILMTTAALVMAMLPLLVASGAGAASRFSLGMVIASGMSIGTLFTLFVVPAMYHYIGRDHRATSSAKGGVLAEAGRDGYDRALTEKEGVS